MRVAKLALRETDKGDQEAGKETENDGPDTAKAE